MTVSELYARRTVKAVERISHGKRWRSDGKPLCGAIANEYMPEPTVFQRGQQKVSEVVVSCPICEALAIVLTAEQNRILREQSERNNQQHETSEGK